MANKVDPQSLIGRRLRVHFNLQKQTYSVTDKGIVVCDVANITLSGVTFHVSESGRARSHRLGKRTVHAYVWGTVESVNDTVDVSGLERVRYNPSKDRAATFTAEDGRPVLEAPRVLFSNDPINPTRGYGWI